MKRISIIATFFLAFASNIFAQTFGLGVLVDTSTVAMWGLRYADIAIDSQNNLGVTWISLTPDNDIVNFAKSEDGGRTWQKTVVCDLPIPPLESRECPAVAFDPQNNPWVVWQNRFWESITDAYIHISHSLDNGNSFGSRYIFPSGGAERHAIAVDDNGTVYIPSRQSSGLHCIVLYGGDYLQRYETLVEPPNLHSGWFPDFQSVGRDTIYIVFRADSLDSSQPDLLYFSQSTDAGSTFVQPVLVSEAPLMGHYGAKDPTITVDESNIIYVAWSDDRTGDSDIYLSKSYDGGISFSDEVRVNNVIAGIQIRPKIIDHQNYGLFVLYRDGIDNSDIFVVRSVDGGRTFGDRISPVDSIFQHNNQSGQGIAIDDSGHLYVAFIDDRYGKNNLFVSSANIPPTAVNEDTNEQLLVENLWLSPNYPNPFNNSTIIQYRLPHSCHVHLEIYNIQGQLVRLLENGQKGAGIYQIRWDGKDMNGRRVGSGVYLYTLQTDNHLITKKMLFLR